MIPLRIIHQMFTRVLSVRVLSCSSIIWISKNLFEIILIQTEVKTRLTVTLTCSMSTIETPEKGVKYAQS